MSRSRRFAPSPAMGVACLALLVSLGGTSIAAVSALPKNSVGTAQIQSNAVTSGKVRNGTLMLFDFAPGQLPAGPRGRPGPAGPAGPAGPQGPPGPSDVYARSVPGPVAVPASVSRIATLSLPQAGKYIVVAKAYFTTTSGTAAVVTCQTLAGNEFDQSVVTASNQTLTSTIAQEFPSADTIEFKCGATLTTAQARSIRLTAVRVGSLVRS